MKNTIRGLTVAALLAVLCVPSFAQESRGAETAQAPALSNPVENPPDPATSPAAEPAKAASPKDPAVEADIIVGVSYPLSATLNAREYIALPFFPGEDFLTSGNKIEFAISQALSPVSATLGFDIVLTPVAFLRLVAGVSAGTGWDLGPYRGLGIHERSGTNDSIVSTLDTLGIVGTTRFGILLQGDVAAVLPGDWNYVQAYTYHELNYRALSVASPEQSWVFQADAGQNRNGWNYYGQYYIGYQMPIVLENLGVLAQTNLRLPDGSGGELWGEDLMSVSFGPALLFRVDQAFTISAGLQFATSLNFTPETAGYVFYQDRVVDRSQPQSLVFSRVALSANFHLK